jgi:hypothetical protein
MLSWYSPFGIDLPPAVQGNPFWEPIARLISQKTVPFSIHLAILVEPYLQFILEGRKTVESRFSVHRCAPYDRVHRGDVVLLKRSGGPIVGVCQVANAWFYELDPRSWRNIRKEFTQALCAQDPSFWKAREKAAFATIMRLQHVLAISPIHCMKRDRRGWVILQQGTSQLDLLSL